jgi:hypothetical protein
MVTTLAEHERGSVIVQLTEMVEHEWTIASTAALASSAGGADPSAPDLLQRVAAEDAATITALLASGPRLRRVLEAPSFVDGDVRAARCAADAGSSSYVGDWPGGAPNSRAAQSGQRTTPSTGSGSSASSTVR